MFRISNDPDWQTVKVQDVAGIVTTIRAARPGRYHIDEITVDSLPCGRIMRHWGVVIKRTDGSVVFQPDEWET
jgi:hypothetical protein